MGNFSKPPTDVLKTNLENGYVGMHIEQGVPVLDRDLNLLHDFQASALQSLIKNHIGNGVATATDSKGFAIEAIPAQNNFRIQAGSALAGGLKVNNKQPLNYNEQDKDEGLPPLTTPVFRPRVVLPGESPAPDIRIDTVFLDVWMTEVDRTVDKDLFNNDDVGLQTSVRQKVTWLVRVAEGKDVPLPIDGHQHLRLAQLNRPGVTRVGGLPRGGIADGEITAAMITDLRQTNLTLSDIERRVRVTLDGVSNVGGKVGVGGIPDPLGRLSLQGLGPGHGTLSFFTHGADVEYDGGNDKLFVIRDNGGKTAFMGGNIGIGTPNPEAPLQVGTLTAISEGTTADGAWANIGSNAFFDGEWKRIDTSKAGVNLHFNSEAGGQEFRFLRVDATGVNKPIAVLGTEISFLRSEKVGIGTASPGYMLDVKSSNGIKLGLEGSGGGQLIIANNPNDNKIFLEAFSTDGASSATELLLTGRNDTAVPRITLKATNTNISGSLSVDGNVGIGTDDPKAKLDVRGGIRSPMWRVTQVFSHHTGPLPRQEGQFGTGGGTLLIFAFGSGFAPAPGRRKIGMTILVDGDILGRVPTFTNEPDSHKAFVGTALVAALPAGEHILSLEALEDTVTDENDFFSVTILELPF